MTWAGIDYGSKLAGTTVIAYAKNNTISFLQSEKKKDADQLILDWIKTARPKQVFLDAPLSLPKIYANPEAGTDFFYRKADRELGAMSPMFLGGLTARAMRLVSVSPGEVNFIETYPGFLAKALELPPKEYKKELQFIPGLIDSLTTQFNLRLEKMPTNWHQFDALLAYISGLRFERKKHLTFGDPAEGQIVV